jgi:fructosamine-3-kinase
MSSPTQRHLSYDEVAAAARVSFGRSTKVIAAEPLDGGSFGAVWRVDLADGRHTVLKAGPADGARLLTYEADMLASEADYLRLVEAGAPDIPAPRLLHETDDWLFMTLVPGVPMPTLPAGVDTATVRFESGAAIARLHTIIGPHFGYPGTRPHASTWPEAFAGTVDAILDDAVTWEVTLPVAPDLVRSAIAAHTDTLATVVTPSLLHFDLWDGNVLATVDMDGQARLSGLVDGERYLYGDPLLDFASPALFRDILERPDDPFVRGYRLMSPFIIDDGVRRRLWLYQLYLYLVMTVEFPSRGLTPATKPQLWTALTDVIRDLIAKLCG